MGDYTLRDIPTKLRRGWKIAAAAAGMTMKDYCFAVLKENVIKDLRLTNLEDLNGFTEYEG